VDRNGIEEDLEAPPRAYAYAHLSPNGTQVALDIRDQENDIWIWDLTDKHMSRLTFDSGMNRGGVWTPDGKRVAFSAEWEGAENIYWQAADGSGSPEPLTEFPNVSILPKTFTPDGKQLLYGETLSIQDIYIFNLDSSDEPKVLLGKKEFGEGNPQISPDGRWLAYQSNETGSSQIYVRPFPDVNAGQWQITTEGGTRPLWNQSGRELFYYVYPEDGQEGAIMAAPVETETSFKFGSPMELFRGEYVSPFLGTQYSVTADGQRFLMMKRAETTEEESEVEFPRKINIVLNWDEELKQRVPVD
jgi:serine/threonine-protein kinase